MVYNHSRLSAAVPVGKVGLGRSHGASLLIASCLVCLKLYVPVNSCGHVGTLRHLPKIRMS